MVVTDAVVGFVAFVFVFILKRALFKFRYSNLKIGVLLILFLVLLYNEQTYTFESRILHQI